MPQTPINFIGTAAVAVLALLIALTLIYALTMFLSSRKREEQSKPKVVTRIECERGDYEQVRDYVDGDYVGKVVGKCPKCGLRLMITGIYKEKVEIPA